MLSINLQAQDEYVWLGENPSSHTFPSEKGYYPLYHQWRTYNAEEPIIVNTYNTGTGKTKAALLRLLKRAQRVGFDRIRPSRDNALLVAPTNELLAQHVTDATQFCEENGLPYRVVAITKTDLETYKGLPNFSEGPVRRAFVLQAILNDASKVDNDTDKGATLYVVNPDIFYYALYYCYGPYDRAALFTDFLAGFNYIIIDEFHYYDSKQFATFLFFIKLSHHRGYIESPSKQRQFCILTATPRPKVAEYLDRLGVPIQWIAPGDMAPADLPFVRPVRALTPVQLHVYSTEELRTAEQWGGLQQLVAQQRHTIRTWLNNGLEGATISSSLGTISRIHHDLSSLISPECEMGRITGPEDSTGRNEAKEKALILATPTVDIGYNFERSKRRQNIDFLLIDAYSGDEFVQRLGRAGRVLSKPEKDSPSIVYAVVEPAAYKLLQDFDGKALERSVLAKLAATEEMPKRNNLYAYIKTGAIAEAFRPIFSIGRATVKEERPDLENFFRDLQQLFAQRVTFKYEHVQRIVRQFEDRQKHYGRLQTFPKEAFDILPLLAERRLPGDTVSDKETSQCLKALRDRLEDAVKQHEPVGRNGREVLQWTRRDLRAYHVEKARFSFRDSFQPPLALVNDPNHLLSSKDVNCYNALHVLKHYHARYYETIDKWEEATQRVKPPDTKDVVIYASLQSLRDEPLQLGLKLNASDYTQNEWEEDFAYQVTALYGLEITVRTDHHGLQQELQTLLYNQFIPVFAALNDRTSSTASLVYRLQQQARFFPMHLDVTFRDGKTLPYTTILGTMAFQVCAEVPRYILLKDRRKTQLADDTPFIC
jgi:CRISPR-associated endonuclease/helicase Cas3